MFFKQSIYVCVCNLCMCNTVVYNQNNILDYFFFVTPRSTLHANPEKLRLPSKHFCYNNNEPVNSPLQAISKKRGLADVAITNNLRLSLADIRVFVQQSTVTRPTDFFQPDNCICLYFREQLGVVFNKVNRFRHHYKYHPSRNSVAFWVISHSSSYTSNEITNHLWI